jgi:outer membrane protein, heavy metal efflux system
LHDAALESRPDLREAQQSLERARTDHMLAIANGTADPTIGADVGRQPPLTFYAGLSVSVPLRIFDKNQGEKLRTELDITRMQRLRDSTETSVFHDVDSAYESLQSTIRLLQPYRSKYLDQAADVRTTVSFAYQHGAASLLDFLDAQKQYRNLRLSYMNLVGAYLSAANQLNFAVGREVVQ